MVFQHARDRDLLRILSRYHSAEHETERLRAVLGDGARAEHLARTVTELDGYMRSVQQKSYDLPRDVELLSADLVGVLAAAEHVQRITHLAYAPDSVKSQALAVLSQIAQRAQKDLERLPRGQNNPKRERGFLGVLRSFEDRMHRAELGSSVYAVRSTLVALANMSPFSEEPENGFFVRASGSLDQRVEAAKLLQERYGGRVVPYGRIPYLGIQASAGSISSLVQDLATFPAYFSLGRLESAHLFTIPAPRVREVRSKASLWGLDRVQAKDAQEAGLSGKGIRVGVVDTGAAYEHDEIKHAFGKMKGIDIYDGTDDPRPRGQFERHGTHVSGTIAGKECGVAPGAELYSIRVLGPDGSGSELFIVAGIEWALENGIHVVSMSLGSPFHSSALDEICSVAYQQGVLLVAAAGNDGDDSDNFPAHLPGVCAVAAIDEQDRRASFSTINEMNDLCAPGVGIYSCVPSGYLEMDGTSMATPHVSGAAALVLERKQVVAEELESALEKHADRLGSREEFGAGCVQAASTAGIRSLEATLRKWW